MRACPIHRLCRVADHTVHIRKFKREQRLGRISTRDLGETACSACDVLRGRSLRHEAQLLYPLSAALHDVIAAGLHQEDISKRSDHLSAEIADIDALIAHLVQHPHSTREVSRHQSGQEPYNECLITNSQRLPYIIQEQCAATAGNKLLQDVLSVAKTSARRARDGHEDIISRLDTLSKAHDFELGCDSI